MFFKQNRFKSILSVLLIITVMFSFAACGKKENTTEDLTKKAKEIGSGENNFYFLVEKRDGKFNSYEIFTDEITVGDALAENGFMNMTTTAKGENYVDTVDGIKVDFENDREYWALYLGSEYLDSNPYNVAISCSDVYIMRIEKLPNSGVVQDSAAA